MNRFPILFSGLGTLKGAYQIKLNSDAIPFVVSTPQRVPIPLLPKVKAELQWMEHLGVISRIEEPTAWCAEMVVVPKKDGSVRICVDLTKLNQAICRERHLLPSIEQALALLENAKVFSKINANSGFWQNELQSLPLSSRHMVDSILIAYHLASILHQNTSNIVCHRFLQI